MSKGKTSWHGTMPCGPCARAHATILSPAEVITAEDLLQRGTTMIVESARRAQGIAKLREESLMSIIRNIAHSLLTTFDPGRLLNATARGLWELGIPRGHVVLCEEIAASLMAPSVLERPRPPGLVLVLSFEGARTETYPPHGLSFPAKQLFPPGLLRLEQPFCMVAVPLCAGDELLGFLLLEAGYLQLYLFAILSEQISAALNASILVKKVHDQTSDLALANRRLESEVFQRKETEIELSKAKEAAEAANRSKSVFLASMSHELRTPLNAIVGYSEMLAEDAAGKSDAQLAADLGKISAAGTHLRAIVNDILDLSKIEAGKMGLYLEEFDLPLVLRGAADAVRPQIAGRSITLTAGFEDAVGIMYGDSTKVRQIAINILEQCGQVHKGRGGAPVCRPRMGGGEGVVQDFDKRHRHRHDKGTGPERVHRVYPGRRVDRADLRRHRTRARHLAEPVQADGGRYHRVKRGGEGIGVCDYAAGEGGEAGRRAGVMRSAGLRIAITAGLLFATVCFSREKPTFRLNIGAEGAYDLSLEYVSEFGTTSSTTLVSKGTLVPSLDIGMSVNSRFSLFLRYFHFLIWSDRSYERFDELDYIAAATAIVPSEKCDNVYLDYSIGLLFWPKYLGNSMAIWNLGLGTTVGCGYRLNRHFRIQIDMDYLGHSISSSINRVTIDPNDSTNTIRNLGEANFGTNWFDIMIGLSAIWDIF